MILLLRFVRLKFTTIIQVHDVCDFFRFFLHHLIVANQRWNFGTGNCGERPGPGVMDSHRFPFFQCFRFGLSPDLGALLSVPDVKFL